MAYGTPASPGRRRGATTPTSAAGRPPTPEQLADLVAPLRRHRRHVAAGRAHRGPGGRRCRPRSTSARPAGRGRARQEARRAVHRGRGGRARRPTGVRADRRPGARAALLARCSVGEYLARAGRGGRAEPAVDVLGIESWHLEPAYLDFLAAAVRTAWPRCPTRTKVLFTAHSLPERILAAGDPYPDQLARDGRGGRRARPASTGGRTGRSPGRARAAPPSRGSAPTSSTSSASWPPPAGPTACSCARCGFVADHLEVLYDLDIEAGARGRATSGLAFARTAVRQRRPRRAGARWPTGSRVLPTPPAERRARRRRGRRRHRRAGRRPRAACAGRRRRSTVLEADDRLGGKIRTDALRRRSPSTTGADAFLARRARGASTCAASSASTAELVAPATAAASLCGSGAGCGRCPTGLVLGVPDRPRRRWPARGSSCPRRAWPGPPSSRCCRARPLDGDDAAIGDAGRGAASATRWPSGWSTRSSAASTPATPDHLSLAAVAPQLAAAARRRRQPGLRGRAGARRRDPAPAGARCSSRLPGGLGRLVDALVAGSQPAGADVRTATPVERARARDGGGWLVEPSARCRQSEADGVVLAVPAFAAAPLLAPRRCRPAAAAPGRRRARLGGAGGACAFPAGDGRTAATAAASSCPGPRGA